MVLNKKERSYVDNAYLKTGGDIGHFEDFLRKNLKGKDDKIKEMLVYFDELKGLEETKEEQEEFKGRVTEYVKKEKEVTGTVGKMNLNKEYRDVVRWIKQVRKFLKTYQKIFDSIKEKRKKINTSLLQEKEKDDEKVIRLKAEMVEAVMNATEVLSITDPNTGEDVTHDSLTRCSADQLVTIMEDNIYELNEFLNKGKIR